MIIKVFVLIIVSVIFKTFILIIPTKYVKIATFAPMDKKGFTFLLFPFFSQESRRSIILLNVSLFDIKSN